MSDAEYQKLYEKIFRVLGDLTPLRADCGLLCNGACRIFPFFPTIDEEGKIYVEEDDRARVVCLMVGHSDEILYDERFLRAVKKVGQMLAKDDSCREFLYRICRDYIKN